MHSLALEHHSEIEKLHTHLGTWRSGVCGKSSRWPKQSASAWPDMAADGVQPAQDAGPVAVQKAL